jgi:serine/threonine-protein kinase
VNLGPYEIVSELGRGGMGVVFRGRAPDGSDVAIKTVVDARPDSVARFERERRILATLGKAGGFVPLIDGSAGPRGAWFAMPFLPRGTLRAKLAGGQLETERAIEIVRALASAIGRAHAAGVVHRDLKPENVLFTDDDLPLIADLGLAKHFRADAPGASQTVALTRDGETRGTIGYLAPEQMGLAKDAGPPCDVFALGAILYECLAGEPAFTGGSATEVMTRIATGERAPLRSLRSDVPRWLESIVDRALAVDPSRRFADGAELARALDAREPARSRGPLIAGAAAAALVLVAIGVFFIARRSTPDAPSPPSAPVVPAAASRPVAAQRSWFETLPASERPAVVPRGVHPGETPGEYVNEKDGSALVWVPAARFPMGTDELREQEKPVHQVEVSGFFLGKLEVTFEQFERFARATGYRTTAEIDGNGGIRKFTVGIRWTENPECHTGVLVDHASFRDPRGDGTAPLAREPVVQVTWDDAKSYCAWAGLRLATEAEWERSARWDAQAKKVRRYAWGDDVPGAGSPRVANLADKSLAAIWPGMDVFPGYDDGFARAAPVGSFPAGASPVGALDMTGNVTEWVEDGFDPTFYEHSPARDPVRGGEGTLQRCTRGGSWGLSAVWLQNQSACRNGCLPLGRMEDIGFRVARSMR